jgi:stage V sporulation protein D (sporulation-specific penicillin-binding protein)
MARLSRVERLEFAVAAFFLYAIFIVFTTFRYSVLEYGYYRGLADKQQTITVKNPVSRGTVYSNNDPIGVFSTSTDLPDLSIDPTALGSKDRLYPFLTDVVYLDLCQGTPDEKCFENVLAFARVKKNEEFVIGADNVKSVIRSELTKRLEKKYVDFVLVKENLTQDEIDSMSSMAFSGFSLVLGNLYADPTAIPASDRPIASTKIQQTLGISKENADFLLSERSVRYVKILRRMSFAAKDLIDSRLKEEKEAVSKGLLTEAESAAPFLIIEPHPTRFYPEKNVGGQVTGFVDNGGVGRYGIEGYFNDELQGQEGQRKTRKDASGRTIGGYDLSERTIVNGADIKLTIDRNVQKEVTRILAEGVREFRANRGSVVVMDPKTGAIIAMAGYPDYDPNDFGSVYELERVSYSRYPNPGFDLLGMPVFVEDSKDGTEFAYDGRKIRLRQATENELGNTAVPKYKFKNVLGPGAYVNDTIGSLYEPGSVFKAITVAIGIDTGDIKPTDTYYDRGYVEIDEFKIKNVSAECIGRHTYLHALDWSCNVGMIDIVQKIGKSLFAKYVADFGFGAKTNVTLEGEVFGKIDPYEKWSRAKLFTQSFGQGITATVLQMATAYSVLANGGVYMQPYVVDSVTLGDGTVIKNSPTPIRRVIKEDTSKKITAMLVEGAKIGFAKKGSVDGYDIAGKTGTSQIASKGKYEEGGAGHTITSYGGFAPASNPKFVMIVKIDRPRSAEFSETTSSALFSKIAKYLLNYYGIPKNG